MQFKTQLTLLLSGLWNKIKHDSSACAPNISEDDIVIFVVGPTGSGKSWFIREATRSNLVQVSRGYHPCTKYVEAIRCDLSEEARNDLKEGPEGINLKSVVFIDTPSFLTDCDQLDAQGEIQAWLSQTDYTPRYAGIIYMHRIETEPGLEPISQHLQEFSATHRIKDGYLPRRVHVLVSYDTTSANISRTKIEDRMSKLREQVDSLKNTKWKPSIHQGLFQGEPEVAWKAVEDIFREISDTS